MNGAGPGPRRSARGGPGGRTNARIVPPVVGLDLAGSERRRTGFCVLSGRHSVTTRVLGDDTEVVRATVAARPALVAIDAPLSLPRGRSDISDRNGPHFRECDRALRALRIPFFPITLGPMRMLTERGIRIRSALRAHGMRVVESYPGGVQDLLGWPRKSEGAERLRCALLRAGFRGDVERATITHDELDAVACAHVARLFLNGRARLVGDPEEGEILLPLPRRSQRKRPSA